MVSCTRRVPGPPPRPTGRDVLTEGVHRVRRVVDGDTLLDGNPAPGSASKASILRNGSRKLSRSSPGARRPAHYTKDFIRRARNNVKLTFGNERLDDYGRYLAFVWDGDRMLNEELVRAGLAEARLGWNFSNNLKRRLRIAQEEAQRENRGIWSNAKPSPCRCSP